MCIYIYTRVDFTLSENLFVKLLNSNINHRMDIIYILSIGERHTQRVLRPVKRERETDRERESNLVFYAQSRERQRERERETERDRETETDREIGIGVAGYTIISRSSLAFRH